jgi:hypothetical protein
MPSRQAHDMEGNLVSRFPSLLGCRSTHLAIADEVHENEPRWDATRSKKVQVRKAIG